MHLLKSFIAKSATIFSHIHIAWYAHFPHIALFFSLMPDCRQSTMQIKLVLVTLILQSLGWWLTHFLFCKLVSDETDYMYLKQSWWIQMIVYHRFFQIREKKLLSTCKSFVFFLMTNLIHVWYLWEMCLWCDEASELVREGSYFCFNSRLVTMESVTPKFYSISEYIFFPT